MTSPLETLAAIHTMEALVCRVRPVLDYDRIALPDAEP